MKKAAVIPGRREAASPESILLGGGRGFRARLGFAAAPRNDSGEMTRSRPVVMLIGRRPS
jgi:hypothetical protein